MELIFIIAIIVIDLTFVGFIFKVFRIWPALSRIDLSDKIIEDSLYQFHHTGTINTNLIGHSINPKKNRYSLKSLIMTKKILVIRNTFLTYGFYIHTKDFVSYVAKKKLIGTAIKINLIIDGEEYFFKFRTKRHEDWVNAFEKIDLAHK